MKKMKGYKALVPTVFTPIEKCDGFAREQIVIVFHRMVKRAFQDYHGDMCGLWIEAVFIKTDYEYNGNTALKYDTEEYMSSIEFDIQYNEK